MSFNSELTVRSYECDSYGHVNNAVYLNYLEYGRMEYLHQIGFRYKDVVKDGYYLYVTHVDIYYKSSAFLDDKLIIEVTPSKLGAVSGTIHQIIKKAENGEICAEANVTWACVKDGKPSKLPAEYVVEGLKPETK